MGWKKYFRRSRWDAERAAEIEAYIEIEADDNIARGMPSGEARAAARRKFGNRASVREEIYRMNSIGFLENFARDVSYGWRSLRKSPGFTAVAVISLALGIGANTAIFSLMDTLMLRSLPVQNPGELVQLGMRGAAPELYTSFSYPVLEAIRDGSSVFAGICAYDGVAAGTVSVDGREETAVVERVGASYFEVFGVQPVIGRPFTTDDPPPAAVISYRYWQRRFQGDAGVLGKSIVFRGAAFPIIGVGPPQFTGIVVETAADIWIPFTAVSRPDQLRGPQAHSVWWLRAIARLKPGVPRASAEASLGVLSAQILENEEKLTRERDTEHRISEADHRNRRERRLTLLPGGRGISPMRRVYSEPLTVLMAVAGLVLLIACANIANLLLARAAGRKREIAVRLAIGAGRARLIRQLLTESLLLAAMGALAGLLFAWWAGRTLVALVVGQIVSSMHFQMDLRVLGFTAAATLATALLFGLGPALGATRGDLLPRRSHRAAPIARLLVAGQAGLSLVLVLGALLFLSTLERLIHQDLGFQADSLLIVPFDRKAVDDTRMLAAHRDLLDRLAAVPGVISATLSDAPFFSGANWTNPAFPESDPGRRVMANLSVVAPNFFETMSMPLVEGRGFTARDDAAGPKVVVINQTLARRLFPGQTAAGRRFAWTLGGGAEIEIAGVVKDIRYINLRQDPPPFVYLPLLQPKTAPAYAQRALGTGTATVRYRGATAGVAEAVRREIRASNASVGPIRTQTDLIEGSLKQERLLAKISGFFGLTGLLLAAVGLYGLMAYTVGRRTSEMGIRMALGARPAVLVRMVLRESVTLVLAGVAVGVAAAFGVTRLIEKFLFGVTATDPAMTALAAALLLAASLLAAWLPALRAARVNPITALRHE